MAIGIGYSSLGVALLRSVKSMQTLRSLKSSLGVDLLIINIFSHGIFVYSIGTILDIQSIYLQDRINHASTHRLISFLICWL